MELKLGGAAAPALVHGAVDAIIVGGGVAGCALAVLLGRAGVRVALYEQHHLPREKVCAEGIMPAGVAVLERLGLLEVVGGTPLRGIRYHGFGRSVETAFPPEGAPAGSADPRPSLGRAQRRFRLDAALFAAARATPGVRALEGARIEHPILEAGRVRGVIAGGSIQRAPLVVGADGARSLLRRRLGLPTRPARHPRIGLRIHLRLGPGRCASDLVEVFVGEAHELYVTPLPGGEVTVAALAPRAAFEADADRFFWRAVERHPRLAELLAGSVTVSTLAGRTPLGQRVGSAVLPGFVLLGDAAGSLDPVTGGGIAQALVSAELLARALTRGGAFDPSDDVLAAFDRERRALYRTGAVLAGLVLGLVRSPSLARGALRLLAGAPSVFSHLVGVAAGTRPLLPL